MTLGISTLPALHNVKLRFGPSIDEDSEPMHVERTLPAGCSAGIREIDFDVAIGPTTTVQMLKHLRDRSEPIYRALLSLGAPVDEIQQHLQRLKSAENDEDFVPDQWNLQIGPIQTGRDSEFHVGWIAVGLSGNGYLYPWTPQHAIERAQELPGIQRLMALCRATWPVRSEAPTETIEADRRAMGTYWPYTECSKPWDWYWGLQGIA